MLKVVTNNVKMKEVRVLMIINATVDSLAAKEVEINTNVVGHAAQILIVQARRFACKSP